MNKVTKKELQQKINVLQSKNITNRNLIFRTMRALASIDIDIMDDKFDATDEPKLKQVDQSVFDGLDAKWRFAAVDGNGNGFVFVETPSRACSYWQNFDCSDYHRIRDAKFEATNWQNSLIERKELTGRDLCEAMFKRGDNYVMCVTGALRKLVIIDTLQDGKLYSFGAMYENPIPINNQGEPLTATDVGL